MEDMDRRCRLITHLKVIYYESETEGGRGRKQIEGEKSLSGKLLSFTNNKLAVEHGADLILTIDHNIQYTAYDLLIYD